MSHDVASANSSCDANLWLGRAHVGHCGVTIRSGNCTADDRGFWTLPAAAWENWTHAATTCLARCSNCERCVFISLGMQLRDCSWYVDCSRFKPAPMFRSGRMQKHPTQCSLQDTVNPAPASHNLRPDLRAYEHVPISYQSIDRWRRTIETYLDSHDYARFARAVGSSVAELINDPIWQQPGQGSVLLRIMSNEKFVPHALNAKGLHALRALLAERMTHRRQLRTGLGNPLFERMLVDGVVVVPDFVGNVSADAHGGAGRTHPANLRVSGHSYVAQLLRRLSGYRHLDLEGFDDWTRLVHYRADSQTWMHVDTFLPTWKAWIFEHTPKQAGPFTYVRGSHRNSEQKLRWLFNRTRRYVSQQALDALHNPSVNAKRMPRVLPWSDEAFGFDPAIRVAGFEPGQRRLAVSSALGPFGFEMPTPVVTGHGWTLVIADTSGLHSRGWARPGEVRTSSVVRSSLAGEDFLPRKNVFFCDHSPEDC